MRNFKDASRTVTLAELAPVIEGQPDLSRVTEIALADLGRRFRLQRIAFEAAVDVFELMRPKWKGRREYLLAQLVGLAEWIPEAAQAARRASEKSLLAVESERGRGVPRTVLTW